MIVSSLEVVKLLDLMQDSFVSKYIMTQHIVCLYINQRHKEVKYRPIHFYSCHIFQLRTVIAL